MRYLLDTNVCISVMHGREPWVREAFRAAHEAGDEMSISSIVHFELQYGVAKSKVPGESRRRFLQTFEAGMKVLEFDAVDAEAAGVIRASLELAKQPIGPYDTLIAGQALARDLTLVTANAREFKRVKGLKWVDWAKR